MLEFEIFNAAEKGAENLKLTAIDVGGDSGFDIGGDCKAGTVLAPEASCTVAVSFTPGTTGDFTGAVAVSANGQGAVVDLTGAGVDPEPPVDGIFHDRFEQQD